MTSGATVDGVIVMTTSDPYPPADQLNSRGVPSGTRMDELLSRCRSAPEPPHRLFGGLDDETWFWLNTEGYRLHPELQRILPSMPEPSL